MTASAGLGSLSVAERIALGKQARTELPRSAHARFAPAADRVDPLAQLRAEDESRVAELVPIRYGRMLTSAFTFFRGSAVLMANDLGGQPHSGLFAQLCGDAHLSNFGMFASPDRRLVFDVDDLDETLPGPFEWDVKRLAASVAIAGRSLGHGVEQRRAALLATVSGYRTRMRELSELRNLELWYSRTEVDQMIDVLDAVTDIDVIARVKRASAKARTKDSLRDFSKLTEIVDGAPRIKSQPPLIMPIRDELSGAAAEHFRKYMIELVRDYASKLASDRRHLLEQFRVVDFARKVVGVGSVGTRCWIILLLGRDDADPLFLQVKEAGPSVLEPVLGPSEFATSGERVIAGQRLMQAAPDILIGWQNAIGLDGVEREFYVRQLKDWKGSARIETMTPRMLELYGGLCGNVLARAHARGGDRIAIAAYLGKGDGFDHAIAEYAELYADQNDADYERLLAAEAEGALEVRRDA